MIHPVEEGKARCTKCKKTKSTKEFYVDSRKKNGISSWCKSCSQESGRTSAKKRKKERTRKHNAKVRQMQES